MADVIWPSEIGVGTLLGDTTRWCREYQMAKFIATRALSPLTNFVNSGLTLSIVGGALSVDVAAGVAIVGGRYVETTATVRVTGLTATNTNYIWLQIAFTGSLASSTTFTANTTGTAPDAYSVCVGKAVTDGSAATSVTNAAPNPTVYTSSYTGDGTSSRLIFLGWQPKRVEIWGDSMKYDGSSDYFPGWACSGNTKGILITELYDLSESHDVPLKYVDNNVGIMPTPATLGFTVGIDAGTDAGSNYSTKDYFFAAYA